MISIASDPTTGDLYGSEGIGADEGERLYKIDSLTGVATFVLYCRCPPSVSPGDAATSSACTRK